MYWQYYLFVSIFSYRTGEKHNYKIADYQSLIDSLLFFCDCANLQNINQLNCES